MSTEVFAAGEDDLVWTTIYGPDEKPCGELGLLKSEVTGRLELVDGWGVNFGSPVVRLPDGSARVGPPVIVLRFPDYPRDGAATYVLGIDDARTVARSLLEHAKQGEQAVASLQTKYDKAMRQDLRSQALKAAADATRCSFGDCSRTRHWFDEQGVGYCKRHAEERGIRPKGKPL